jgi:hypothetical protein
VYAFGDPSKYLLPDEGLKAFMTHCQQQLGEVYFRTPRTTITAFIDLLSVLEQNPTASWQVLLGAVRVEKDNGGLADHDVGNDSGSGADEFATFKL